MSTGSKPRFEAEKVSGDGPTELLSDPNARAVESQSALRAAPATGQMIGKYVIERVIGQGGMGVVLAARNEALGELVAIKLLNEKASRDRVQAERFAREARATVKIKSEHVVRVLDVGQREDNGAPYIVMEYLTGRDLGQMLAAGGPLPWQTAVEYLLQICEAVASAHQIGVVHRDLKPSNFVVTERADGAPLLKVLDFGISKALPGELDHGTDPKLTETQAVFGSPTYMSPEQIRSSKNVDQRSDVWSLGVALFEMTTGKLPFMADTISGILASIVADPPFRPSAFVHDMPEGLEEAILACLEKDPRNRVQSVGDLAARLRQFATGEAALLAERVARMAFKPSGEPSSRSLPPSRPSMPSAPSNPSVPAPVAFGTTGMDLSDGSGTLRAKRRGAALFVGIGAVGALLVGLIVMNLRPVQQVIVAAPPPPATAEPVPVQTAQNAGAGAGAGVATVIAASPVPAAPTASADVPKPSDASKHGHGAAGAAGAAGKGRPGTAGAAGTSAAGTSGAGTPGANAANAANGAAPATPATTGAAPATSPPAPVPTTSPTDSRY